MTEHELLILMDGIIVGFDLAMLLFVVFEMRTDRRARKQLAAHRQWRESLGADLPPSEVVRANDARFGTEGTLPGARITKDRS